MTIKFDAANSEALTAPGSASFNLLEQWALGFVIAVDGSTTGDVEQMVLANGAHYYVAYTGSGHAYPNTIVFDPRDGNQSRATPNILSAGTKLMVVVQKLNSTCKISWCPILTTEPVDGSAVTSMIAGNIYGTYGGVGPFSIGGPTAGNPGVFCDQSIGRVFKVSDGITDLEIAQLAYGKTMAQIGRDVNHYVRMNDANDIVDTGVEASTFTKVGTLSTGTNPGFGFGAPPPLPDFTSAPVITGSARIGAESSYTSGAYTGTGEVTQQWTIDGVDVAGADGPTYLKAAGQEGKALRLRQTITNETGSDSATSVPVTILAAIVPAPPTGTILPSPQPDPSGQSKRFILTTTNTTEGAYTLIGQSGAPNTGPTAFALDGDGADFLIEGIAPASYLPRFTLTGPYGTTNIDGSPFTIVGVSGGGTGGDPPANPAPTAPGTIPVIAGTAGSAISPVIAAAAFSDTDALSYSISPAGTAWPLGLGVHTSTGVISGTVAEVTVATGLKVRATDTIGQFVDSSPFAVAITAASNPDNDPLFKPSLIRTIRAKAGVLKFDGGAFWNLAVPSTPVGVIDPDAIVDITMDWTEVLADIQDTIAGADVEATNADVVQAFTVGPKTTVFITAAKGNLVQIRFRIDTQSNPSRREDRTVYLKVGEQ